MFRYSIKRILLAVLTTAIILTMTFFLVKLQPFPKLIGAKPDMILAYYLHQADLGYVRWSQVPRPEWGELLDKYVPEHGASYYFYQESLFKQYWAWVQGIFQGNWGLSNKIAPNVDAMTIILDGRLLNTIKVNIWPVIISVPSGIALGIWAALKKNKMTDHIISTLVMVFISVPSFIVINFLLFAFAYTWKILPTQWPASTASTRDQILGYIIPTLALSFGSICGYCRFTRAELTEVMSSDFLLLARTKGLTKSQSITRHALKNAMVPILPSILSEVIGLLGGSMILESLYGIPGVGFLYITAIQNNDYNVLMADMALYTLIGLVSGVFLDLSYGFIDPRIRMGAKK
ncbi:MAG: ABC transporter permease [Candidatus Enteromonas sp.]|nr:ABC transporter permease [Candidatus Enteromonas sp.]